MWVTILQVAMFKCQLLVFFVFFYSDFRVIDLLNDYLLHLKHSTDNSIYTYSKEKKMLRYKIDASIMAIE